ncbi:MAG TPA: GTPase [Actinomycetota bacterium]|nr:GTPase [Actinomycetota bacterium]
MKPLLRSKQAPNLDQRLEGLRRVVELARDRLEPSLVDDARAVLERGTERMGFGKNLTLVALAGATGTGKSSLFNKLAGTDLAPVGVRRPTTATAQAAAWGEASEVLDWLGVGRRHGLSDSELDGLVLLDLPDHDSTEVQHRLEADRLVQLVDVFVWVVDPQKYADAALHDGYLRPLATHAAVSVVVLNQIDKLSEAERRQCVNDLGRLLKEDGLKGVEVLSTSTVTGEGIDSLRSTIEARVHQERAAAERLAADLDALAGRLAPFCGGQVHGLGAGDRERLLDALAAAAGVDVVSRALGASHRRDAGLAMGWPFVRWMRRFRPDPLGRLHLRRGGEGGRTSLPAVTPLQKAQVDNAVRAAAGSAGSGLVAPWPDALRNRVYSSTDGLLEKLDAAVSSTELGEDARPVWWSVANGIQVLLAAVAIAGFLWLALLFGLEWLQIPRPPTPRVEEVPWPTLALLGGLGGGLLLSAIFQQFARLGARRRRRRAEQRLRARIGEVANRAVIGPIEAELAAHREFCEALAALKGGR